MMRVIGFRVDKDGTRSVTDIVEIEKTCDRDLYKSTMRDLRSSTDLIEVDRPLEPNNNWSRAKIARSMYEALRESKKEVELQRQALAGYLKNSKETRHVD